MSSLNLAEALQAERKPPKGNLQAWIDALDEDDRLALEAAKVDPNISNAALVRVIRAAGRPVNKDTIASWRSG